MFYIGTDIGGTFTDTVLVDGEGRIRMYKTPTTPGNLPEGIMAGLNLAADDFDMSVQDLLAQLNISRTARRLRPMRLSSAKAHARV